MTSKLCLAPNETLRGVAVGGGENKTHTGNDFRVSLLARDSGALSQLALYADKHPGRLAAGRLLGARLGISGGAGGPRGGACGDGGFGGLGGFGGMPGLGGGGKKSQKVRGKRAQV